jgi:hypothetical protein
MLDNLVCNLLPFENENKLLIFTEHGVCEETGLRSLLALRGYSIYDYINVEQFRIEYEETIKTSKAKVAVLVQLDIYVPYDVRRSFHIVSIFVDTLFPNLNTDIIKKHRNDWDIIAFAAEQIYSDCSQARLTEIFLNEKVFSYETVRQYCNCASGRIEAACKQAVSYRDWVHIAKYKASIQYYAAMKNIEIDLTFADEAFSGFIADGYGRLSQEVSNDYPSIITKVMTAIISDKNSKSALIVMDGMSLFDFKAISRHFGSIDYEYGATYALIPTTTPISRQSLLSGKYPRELDKPFSTVNEEKEFKAKAATFGLTPNQIEYLRGYDAEISPLSRMVAVIINDVDEIAHGQFQGRAGMLGDMDLLGKSGKLQSLINRLTANGFTVYITADHGNTLCVGVGGFRSGVEMESRSMRMAVLKDVAEANTLLNENTTEYLGFYLDKEYRYFVCKSGVSFDSKGETVMTHGGMSIDEVIVPFIKVRRV